MTTPYTITTDENRWEAIISGEIPFELVAKQREQVLKDLQATTEIKGFRKGHVPLGMIESQYPDSAIMHQAAEYAIQYELPEILATEKVNIVEAPKVTIESMEKDAPLKYSAHAALAPQIQLGDYQKLKDTFPKEPQSLVSDSEHTEAQTHIRRERVRIEKIESGEKPGNASQAAKDMPETELPALDDEFAQQLGYTDAVAFQEALRNNIQNEKDMQAHQKRRASILDALVKDANIKYPATLREYEMNEIEHQFTHDLSRMGATLEKYLEDTKQTKEDLLKSWEPGADNRARVRLALAEVARREHIAPTAQVVSHEMEHAREHYKDADESLLRNHITHALRNEMAIRFLEGDTEPVGHTGHDHE